MTQTLTEPKLLTFEEYRFYQSNDDRLYELYKGRLIPLDIPTNLHTRICDFLVYELKNYLVSKNRDLIVGITTGVRTEINSSRIPDVVICSRELWEILGKRAGGGILDFGETPRLVVEVTSDNWREDYVEKRREYALIQVPEYWIINPNKKVVLVLNYNPLNQEYEEQEFKPGSSLISREFPDLFLEVNTIISPPIVEDLIRVKQWQYQEVVQELNQVEKQLELEKIPEGVT